jgi:anti-anti-sigma factor
MANLQIDVTYTGSGSEIAVLTAKGYVDSVTVKDLEQKILSQLTLKKYKLVIDMKKISYVNSSGWGIFLRELKEIRENKGDILLAGMSPDVFDVYEKMEFSTILKSYDTVQKAVASFSQSTA